MHGLGAEDRFHQCPAGAQSDPTWRHVPEGGAGGEQEELPEESCPSGGSGRVTEGEEGEAGVNIQKSDESDDAQTVNLCLSLAGGAQCDAVSGRAAVQ